MASFIACNVNTKQETREERAVRLEKADLDDFKTAAVNLEDELLYNASATEVNGSLFLNMYIFECPQPGHGYTMKYVLLFLMNTSLSFLHFYFSGFIIYFLYRLTCKHFFITVMKSYGADTFQCSFYLCCTSDAPACSTALLLKGGQLRCSELSPPKLHSPSTPGLSF